MDIEKQLDRLDKGQLEILRRIDNVDGELADVKDTLRDTLIEIGGAPDDIGRDPNRRSLRSRVHLLENDRASARTAEAALDAARQLRETAADRRFSRSEKLIGLLLAAVIAVGPYIAGAFFH